MSAARFATVVLAILALAAPARAQPAFAPAPWLQDLDQLRDAMTASYPNLEWHAKRGMDLPGVYSRARQRLEGAQAEADARFALERFIATFGDGHLEIHWPAVKAANMAQGSRAAPPLCTRLGYFDVGESGAVATHLAGYRSVGAPGALIPAGVAEVGGRRVGILRIPMFDPVGLPALCARLTAQEKLQPDSPCDKVCEDRLSRLADAALIAEMQAGLRALTAAHAEVLLVDIAGNGGGNDSAIALARMVTAKPLLTPPVGIVRDAGWVKPLQDIQTALRDGLGKAAATEAQALRGYDATVTRALAEVAKPCDSGPLWSGKPIACSMIVTGVLYAGGLSPDPPLGASNFPWSETVSSTARFPHTEPLWRGPVIVLVDFNSASASELFAAMLQDQGAAAIIGSPSFGAGCGHMNEAEPLKLKNSGATVKMPDCLRLRADGTNELDGIQPDVLIGLRQRDSLSQRVSRLTRALPQAFPLAERRR